MKQGMFLWGLIGVVWASPSWALHPLITEDTGTQGKGAVQVELEASLEQDRIAETRKRLIEPEVVLTYGLLDHVDLFIALPYLFKREEEGAVRTQDSGVFDTVVGFKWRFFEQDGYSLAIRPALQLPTGNDSRGLGLGRANLLMPLIFTRQWQHTAMHVQAVYLGNQNTQGERKHLWRTSIAVEHELHEGWKLVADLAVDRNSQPGANQNPTVLLVGAVLPVSGAELSLGYQRGLNKAAPDHKALLGLTWHFK